MTSPTAPEFDVQFARPEDAQASWIMDRMYFPHPLPALAQDVMRGVLNWAFDNDPLFVNGYAFMKDYSPPPPTPEVLEKGV